MPPDEPGRAFPADQTLDFSQKVKLDAGDIRHHGVPALMKSRHRDLRRSSDGDADEGHAGIPDARCEGGGDMATRALGGLRGRAFVGIE
jgi:hypothetical protein